MTPTKILIGQMITVFAIVIGGLWLATQWAAAMLGHQARLGPAWFDVLGLPVYYPWRLFEWWYAFEPYAPTVFHKAGALAAGGGLLGAVVAVIGSVWRARQARHATTYGSSRWATPRELRKAGLFEPRGVVLGRLGKRYLRHDGPEHVMAFAPTRSGKGVGLVIPTLLSWTGSAVIHDIKGENWELTAGWRSTFSHCLLFNPTDLVSARYNPLVEVRKGDYEVRDAQNIADILVDPEGALEQRNHWQQTAHALLVGAILHVLYAEPDKTLAGVARLLSDPTHSFERTLRVMMTTNHLGSDDAPLVHPVVAASARDVLNKSYNERSGVLSTAISFLSLYRDPVIAATTSRCDWRIADLVDASSPVSLYLVIPPGDISRTKPVVRLILNQIGRRLTETLVVGDGQPNRHQLLMMLDEFPALGRLDFFESALAFMAGYGIRAFLIAQSLNQISKAYGENNSILDNCHVRVAFSSNDERTAKRISDSLGTATELKSQKNYAGHRLAPWLAHVMVSRQEFARPLLTPGEVMQLPAPDQLLLVSGLPPVRARKLRYYEDRNFTRRHRPPPALSRHGYHDLPAVRGEDWGGRLRKPHPELARSAFSDGNDTPDDNGGLQKQLPLADELQRLSRPVPENEFGRKNEEPDPAADARAVDQSKTSQSLRRAVAISRDDDLMPTL